jgi:hypothetical protein
MVFYGFFERSLQAEEAFVDSGGIAAVQRDHLRSRFAAASDLERLGLHAGDNRICDRGRGSREKPSSGPARFDLIIGVSVPPG